MVELDTSGEVLSDRLAAAGEPWRDVDGGARRIWRWRDLNTFEQGVLRQALEEMNDRLRAHYAHGFTGDLGFRHLATATLQQVKTDCARFADLYGEWPLEDHGRGFWIGRQKGKHTPEFWPLFPNIGADGLVYFLETPAARQAIAHATGGGK